jgi:hypothetical protein
MRVAPVDLNSGKATTRLRIIALFMPSVLRRPNAKVQLKVYHGFERCGPQRCLHLATGAGLSSAA